MDDTKRGYLLTIFILTSICYILYSTGDEKSPETGELDDGDYNGLNALNHRADDDYADIGKDVEYVEDYVDVGGYNIFYTYATSTVKNHNAPKLSVVLLHGAAYRAQTWKSLGTLQYLAREGYLPIAIDLPGFGKTKSARFTGDESDFMVKLVTNLYKIINVTPQVKQPVILSPSMSGRFSLPYIFKHEKEVTAFIPIAPLNRYTSDDFKSLTLPILIICGDLDKSGLRTSFIIQNAQNSRLVRIVNGEHPAYLSDPVTFHTEMKKFLDEL